MRMNRSMRGYYLVWGIGVMMWLAAVVMLIVVQTAEAAGTVYNTVQTSSKVWDCTLPTARTDGMALEQGDLATVEYYTAQDPTASPAPVAVKALDPVSPDCAYEVDFTSLPLGQNYMWATVTDTVGNQSSESTPAVPFELTRVWAPPNAPTAGGFVDAAIP